MKFEVVVGNIGTVYVGKDGKMADKKFNLYTVYSKENLGRAAGEDVTLMNNGEIAKKYLAPRREDDTDQ